MQPPTSSSLPSFMAPLKGNRWAPLAQPERAQELADWHIQTIPAKERSRNVRL